MKVEFLKDVNISDKYTLVKGQQFEAVENENFIMIHMKDDCTIKAPKNALGEIFRIV